MLQFEHPKLNQHDVFELQLIQFVQRNKLIHCQESALEFDAYTIAFDRARVIKKPGYEILMQNVSKGQFNCHQNVSINYESEGQYYEVILIE